MFSDIQLAELCASAYSDPWDDTTACIAVGHDHACVIETTDRNAVVAFRGTDDTADWVSNTRRHRVPWEGVLVHQGFLEAYLNIREEVLRAVDGKSLTITGHSRGAALATLLAMDPRTLCTRLVTFGSPRVVNDPEAAGLDSLSCRRYVCENDPVTMIPWIGYRHVGETVWLVGARRHHRVLVTRWLWTLLTSRARLWFDSLADHSIAAYLKRLRLSRQPGEDF